MREIVLDTETTGLDPKQGHRIVEIGCVETLHHIPTGNSFHAYINPERDMPEEAFNVHGLSEDFLSDKPVFAEVVSDFLAFVADAPLVIHNAEFDMRFINAELERLGFPALAKTRAIDTVSMARKRFPGAQVNLDALCRRFEVDLSRRDKHGALLDAELLAEVYLNLRGGRQPGLELAGEGSEETGRIVVERQYREPRPHDAPPEELAAHAALLDAISDPIWRREG